MSFIVLINLRKKKHWTFEFFLFSVCLLFYYREMRLVSNTLSECYEPLIIAPISVQSLSRWGRQNEFLVKPTDYSALEGPRHRANPFPCSDQINSRFIIW